MGKKKPGDAGCCSVRMCNEEVARSLDPEQHALASQRGTSVLASEGTLLGDGVLHDVALLRSCPCGMAACEYVGYPTLPMQIDATMPRALKRVGNIPHRVCKSVGPARCGPYPSMLR